MVWWWHQLDHNHFHLTQRHVTTPRLITQLFWLFLTVNQQRQSTVADHFGNKTWKIKNLSSHFCGTKFTRIKQSKDTPFQIWCCHIGDWILQHPPLCVHWRCALVSSHLHWQRSLNASDTTTDIQKRTILKLINCLANTSLSTRFTNLLHTQTNGNREICSEK